MKNLKFFLPLAAVGLLASCSNDNLGEPENEVPVVENEGQTYMNISITMPVAGIGTKADGFDDYYDGSEDKLDEGWVYLIDKTSDKFVAKGYLDLSSYRQDGANKDITGTINFFNVPVDNAFDSSNKPSGRWDKGDVGYYALIILNSKTGITLPKIDNTETYTSWSTTAQDGEMKYAGTGSDSETTYFTMTNALGWSGTVSGNPSVLVEVSNDDLYLSKEGNKNDPVKFYVQRVLSKVTLSTSTGFQLGAYNNTKIYVEGTRPHQVKLVAWDLNVTNKKTYPVQLIKIASPAQDAFAVNNWMNWASPSDDQARFISKADTKFRRVFWALDPNYSGANATTAASAEYLADFTYKNAEPTNTVNGIYCKENTFDLYNMNKNQSTQIMFVADYDITGTNTPVSFVKYGNICVELPDADIISSDNTKGSGTYTIEDLIVNTKLATTYDQDNGEVTQVGYFDKLKCQPGDKVDYYKNGRCYYTAIIRHFSDDELDGASTDGFYDSWAFRGKYVAGETVDGDDLKQYLGRYGMVRNNWYEIAINSISGPGYPVPPYNPTPDPDDDPNPYNIDLEINILAWAKRTFGYDL